MANLLTIKGHNVGVRFKLKERTHIGRDEANDIVLPDESVSRFHAEVVKKERAFIIIDKNSKNGIVVNGKRVDKKLLKKNDELLIGQTVFLYDSDYDLKNVRFGQKTLYIAAPHEETVSTRAQPALQPGLEQATISLDLIKHLSALFSPYPLPFPQAMETMMYQIAKLFAAEQGFIMLWETSLNELQPVVAWGKDQQLAADKAIINSVFHENRAFYSSSVEVDMQYSEAPDGGAKQCSVIATPLPLNDKPLGIIYLSRSMPHDFSLKDLQLLQAISRLISLSIEHSRLLDHKVKEEKQVPQVIYQSQEVQEIMETIRKIAPHSATVLFCGETGTGKEILARHLHYLSPKRNYPFITVNCAAIPETLFESELFGYEKGAFTGAEKLRQGLIEMAQGGILFLDEISELSAFTQPKLLRFLQEKIFYRVGGTRPIKIDVTIVAASNVDLEARVKEGRFRQDLYYRLKVMEIDVPPLRDRRADIKPLAEQFVKTFSQEINKPIYGITDEALIKLERYAWPGNVRELQNCIERAVILCNSTVIKPDHLLLEEANKPSTQPAAIIQPPELSLSKILPLKELEKRHIERTLIQCNWNQVKAAEILGIHRNTLRKKLADYQIRKE